MSGVAIEVGTIAPDDYDNMGGKYLEANGYIFWENEWALIERAANDKLNREHPASNLAAGTKADIYGNIVPNGSSEAFYEVQQILNAKLWQPLY